MLFLVSPAELNSCLFSQFETRVAKNIQDGRIRKSLQGDHVYIKRVLNNNRLALVVCSYFSSSFYLVLFLHDKRNELTKTDLIMHTPYNE